LNLPKEHLFDIAQKYIKKGQHKKAIKEYQKVLYLDPQLVDVYHKLANLYLKENLIGSARLQYHNILKIEPDDPIALEALEKIEQDRVQGESPSQEGPVIELSPMVEESTSEPALPGREKPMESAIITGQPELQPETDTKDLETHYHLGIAYKEMELIDHAIAEFQTAAADRERRFDCLVMLGMCFMEKEEYDQAINCFNDASGVKELSKEQMIRLRYRLGLAYESNGMNQEALKAYHQVIDLDSTFLDVKNRIERLKRPS